MNATPSAQAPVRTPLPIRNVRIDDDFWARRRAVVRERTLPHQYEQLRTGGQLDALALNWEPGLPEPHIFWESDIGKWIEAASYTLWHHPDPELEARIDEVVTMLARAQQPDGYLNVYFTLVKPGQRFTDLRDAHELYCLGHLIEGAVAYADVTGKREFLDLVVRYTDLVEHELSPGGSAEGGYDGHQEIELALIKLARATGEPRYRELAARMIDDRGSEPFYFETERDRRGDDGYFGWGTPSEPPALRRYREYNQSHAPVREQRDAVGHSVRAMYQYIAMTDLAIQTGDDGLRDALLDLWDSVTERKMYLTGGIGSDPSIEGFGEDYDLPLQASYNETCASIGLIMWAQRMALLTGQARFVDTAELALYNTVLAGSSTDGTRYFYDNPMLSDGQHTRSEWFGVACCPPNLARLLASLETYAYAYEPGTAVVDLFIGGTAAFPLESGEVTLRISTEYPWHGTVSIAVESAAEFTLAVRVPGWASEAALTLNGEPLDGERRDGYARVRRTWAARDVLALDLPMRPRRVQTNPAVQSTLGKVAIARGPVVYCVESIDHDVPVGALALPHDAELSLARHSELDVPSITASAVALSPPAGSQDSLYFEAPGRAVGARMTAVPYFLWENRGASSMRVWLPQATT